MDDGRTVGHEGFAGQSCQTSLAAASVELIPCRSDHAKSCGNGTSNSLWNYQVITSD